MLGNKLRNWTIAAICLLMLGTACPHPAPKDSNTTSRSVQEFPSGNVISPPSAMSSASYLIGHFEYKNGQFDNWMPLAFAQVEVRYTNNTLIDRTYTDAYGNFTSAIDVPESGATVICSASTCSPRVTVLNPETSYTYSADTYPIFVEPNQNKTITIQFRDDNKWFTVFSLHSGLNKGWYYIYNTVGSDVLNATAFYPYGQIPEYLQEDRCMYLPVETYDYSDEILHEYAHYVMHRLYGWWWPPNATGNYSIYAVVNQTMAWTEGWAYYFPLAVAADRVYEAYYESPIDFENQSWATSGWNDGDAVIGRVTGALWDIYDSQNDTSPWNYENLSDGFVRTWDTTSVVCSSGVYGLRMFWNLWNETYYDHSQGLKPAAQLEDWTATLLSIFQNSIDYRGQGDAEVDGVVDGSDNCIVAWRFGSWEEPQPSPRWDYLSDLNHDCVIDGADLAIVRRHFGESYDC
jgi:hypothetical protein